MMKLEEVISMIKRDPMIEKVINTLSSILNDTTVKKDSFNIIPTLEDDVDCNRSPVHYVEHENCIGLESWCIKHLYKYCHDWVVALNKAIHERNHPPCDKISSSQETRHFGREYVDLMDKYLTVTLLINSDVHTFWNIKRAFILDAPEQFYFIREMEFTGLILSYKPKSLQTYTYRAWLINRWGDPKIREETLMQEIKLTGKLVLASANNYHGWNHRIWCIQESRCFGIGTTTKVKEELQFSYDYINQNVSDHSGFHYRQYILEKCRALGHCWHTGKSPEVLNVILMKFQLGKGLKDVCRRTDFILFLCELLECCNELNQRFPSHEAIWYHRRFAFGGIVNALYENGGIKLNSPTNDHDLKTSENSLMYNYVLWLESKYIKKLSEDNANYSWDMICLERYQKWLKYSFHIDLDKMIDFKNTELMQISLAT